MATGNKVTIPIFDLPKNGRPLWELGRKDNWLELDVLLTPLEENGGFWVRRPEEEAFLEDVVGKFDDSTGDGGSGAVHYLVNDENVGLLQRVLSLGVNPDLSNNNRHRPSHWCWRREGPDCALTLAVCRPDLEAKGHQSQTPLERAQSDERNRPGVASVWEKVLKEGPPSIARLASEQTWWAVKNLVRRRVVPDSEKFLLFKGKDAIGWARHHGMTGMSEELEYYFFQKKDEAKREDLSNDLKSMMSQLITMTQMAMRESETREKVENLSNDLTRQTSFVQQLTVALEAKEEELTTNQAALLEARNELEQKDSAVASLQAELDAYKKKMECSICMDAESNHAFLPCGHLACENCAQIQFWTSGQPREGNAPKCPKCRVEIKAVPSRIFFD